MADKKGNTGVILAVLGVTAALGLTLYLLTRKSKKIDNIGANAMSVGNMPVGGVTNYQPAVTQQPQDNSFTEALKKLNDELMLKVKENAKNNEGTDRGQA